MLKKKYFLIAAASLMILAFLFPAQAANAGLSQDILDLRDTWRNNTAYVDEVLYKIIQGDEQQLLALKNGEIDVVGDFVASQFISEDLLNDPNIGINKTQRRGFGHVSFNTAKWPTDQRGLRRALAFAVDKYAISEEAWGGESRPVDSPVVPSIGIWSIEHDSALRHLPENYYDPNPVKGNHSLLQDGFYDIDNDGWREWFNATKAGKAWSAVVDVSAFDPDAANPSTAVANEAGTNPTAFTVTDTTTFNNLNNWEEVSFEIIGSQGSTVVDTVVRQSQKAYHSVGIDAKISFVDFNNLLQQLTGGTFNAAFFGYSTGPTPLFLQSFMTDDPNNGEVWRWSNATYDDAVDTLLNTPYIDDALDASYTAQEILWYEQPMVVMYNNLLISVYRTDKFSGWIQASGSTVSGGWSTLKVHLTDAAGNPVTGGKLVQSLGQSMESQNPLNTQSAYSLEPLSYIYDSLWTRDPYTLQIIPWLADDWDVELVYNDTLQPFTGDLSTINLTETPLSQKITFHLNPDFKWHDGQPVLPEDVAFTYKLYVETNSPTFLSLTKAGGGTIDPDRITYDNNAGTVTFIIESLGLFSFTDTGGMIFPKHIWEPLLNQLGPTSTLNYNNDNPIGSGPYKWKSRVPGTFILLERNNEWPFRPDRPTTGGGGEQSGTTTTATSTAASSEATTTAPQGGAAPGFEIALVIAGLGLSVTTVIYNRRRRR